MTSNLKYTVNNLNSSPKDDAWFDEMFEQRSTEYDDEEVTPESDVDETIEDTFNDTDDL